MQSSMFQKRMSNINHSQNKESVMEKEKAGLLMPKTTLNPIKATEVKMVLSNVSKAMQR